LLLLPLPLASWSTLVRLILYIVWDVLVQLEVLLVKGQHMGIVLPQGNSDTHEPSDELLKLLRVSLDFQYKILI